MLECAITGVPDPERGQVVKATIVLTQPAIAPSDALAKELQQYVKKATAPYKYPRVVEFVDRAAQDHQRQNPPGGNPRQGCRRGGRRQPRPRKGAGYPIRKRARSKGRAMSGESGPGSAALQEMAQRNEFRWAISSKKART